jgi:hypothetical protein
MIARDYCRYKKANGPLSIEAFCQHTINNNLTNKERAKHILSRRTL